MKISESIIEKYQLTPSDEQTGQSFIQNQLLYRSGLPGFEGIIFMECDFSGKPSQYINFYNKKKANRDGSLTHEFMEAVPIEVILKSVS